MITYAERKIFTVRHRNALEYATARVERVGSRWKDELRCHELTRAVMRTAFWDASKAWGLTVIDGKCGPVEHSWLQFDDGIALDIYAPGRYPSVQLVDGFIGSYTKGAARTDINESLVNQLVHEMRGH